MPFRPETVLFLRAGFYGERSSFGLSLFML